MAKELPYPRSFLRTLRRRLGTDVYGNIRGFLDTVLPVQVVGSKDFADEERPRWGIASASPHLANPRYCTSSITSIVDIAIEEIAFEMRWDATHPRFPGFPVGDHPMVLLTPDRKSTRLNSSH